MKKVFSTLILSFFMFIASSFAISCVLAYVAQQQTVEVVYAAEQAGCVTDPSCMESAYNQYNFSSSANAVMLIACCVSNPFSC